MVVLGVTRAFAVMAARRTLGTDTGGPWNVPARRDTVLQGKGRGRGSRERDGEVPVAVYGACAGLLPGITPRNEAVVALAGEPRDGEVFE